MAMPMIQMMMARELRGFVPDAELNPIVQENLDLFFRRHVDRERKCVFERVLPDGGHLFDVMEGRLLNPGHAGKPVVYHGRGKRHGPSRHGG